MNHLTDNVALLSSAALFALIAVVIPIILHLLNPNKEKIVWIGHIELVKTTTIKKITQIYLLNKLLLFVRICLVVVLAFLLAKPVIFDDVETIEEEHIYVSFDWLKNTDDSHHKDLSESNIASTVKFFLLEQPEISFNHFQKLVGFYRNSHSVINTKDYAVQDLLGELKLREKTPKLTHLYFTNRAKNYSAATIDINNSANLKFNILSLPYEKLPKKISLVVYYPSIYANVKDQLQSALRTLNQISSLELYIAAKEYKINTTLPQITLGQSDINIIIVNDKEKMFENTPNKLVRNAILVQPKPSALTFNYLDEQVSQTDEWDMNQPEQLLLILSHLIDNSKKLSEVEQISINQKTKVIKVPSSENNRTTESLDSLLIFLFSLFWLLERWLVLKQKPTVGDIPNVD